MTHSTSRQMEKEPTSAKALVLVSACLLGQAVRYDGTAATVTSPILDRWRLEGRIVAICPEVAGGCPVPRVACEIVGGDGESVLDGLAAVVGIDDRQETDAYRAGARAALAAAQRAGVQAAILKGGSPSCASRQIYDGTFLGRLKPGKGVAAALLERNGIRTFSEHEIDLAAAFLAGLDSP